MKKENAKLRKQLNSISFIGLEGIKVGDALAMELWNFTEWNKDTIANIEFAEIKNYSYKVEGKKPELAFYFAYTHVKRYDMLEKFRAVQKLFDNKLVIEAQNGEVKRNPYTYLIPLWYAQLFKLRYSPIIKLGICYKLCEAFGHAEMVLERIKKHDTIKKVVLFHDVSGMDSMLAQKCNQNNFVTYTLQHGIVNGSYDYNEYRCSHAQYLLLWGQYSKRMAIRYGKAEESIKVVGNINALLHKQMLPFEEKKNSNCFAVCTNGVINRDNWQRNQELIEIANYISKKYAMKYILKVHPYDNKNRYSRIVNREACIQICDKKIDITEVLSKVEFTLCGNSTTFCDSIYWGVPAFRYITEAEKSVDVCKGIGWGKFDSSEKLEEILEKFREKRAGYASQLDSVNNYLFDMEDVEWKYRRGILEENVYVS